MMFGKLNDQSAEQSFKVFFEALKTINDDLSNPHAKMMFDKLMGKTAFAKFKKSVKATAGKISAKVKIGAKATADAAKKAGDAVKDAAKKTADAAKAGAAKLKAGAK